MVVAGASVVDPGGLAEEEDLSDMVLSGSLTWVVVGGGEVVVGGGRLPGKITGVG